MGVKTDHITTQMQDKFSETLYEIFISKNLNNKSYTFNKVKPTN